MTVRSMMRQVVKSICHVIAFNQFSSNAGVASTHPWESDAEPVATSVSH